MHLGQKTTVQLGPSRSSPIRRLPVELLAEIFRHCIPGRDTQPFINSFNRKEVPLLLGRVCSYWRSVAYSTPILWASLSITFHTKKLRHDTNLIKAWIARSGECPLTIAVDEVFALPWMIRPVIDVLVAVSYRWEHVTIHLRSQSVDSLTGIKSTLPLLKSLKLYLGASELATQDTRDIFEAAPQLHIVNLNFGLDAGWFKLPWAQLTEFSAINYPRLRSDECVSILVRCPNLISCTFGSIYRPLSTMYPVDWKPHFHLRTLQVYSTASLTHFFDCIMLPALCSIRIDGHLSYVVTELISLLSRSSSVLESAHFDVLSKNEEDHLIRCLEHMPSLVELRICQHKACFKINGLLRRLTPSPGGIVLAPKLQNFVLQTDRVTFDKITFVDMLRSRRPSPEGRSQSQTECLRAIHIHCLTSPDDEFLDDIRYLSMEGLDVSLNGYIWKIVWR
jgi:hypothetical protein